MEKARSFDDYDYEVAENDDFDIDEYLIDVNEEEVSGVKDEVAVLEQEIQREKTLMEALLNLMSKQASLTAVRSVIWFRETKDKIDNIVKGMKEKAQIYEKDYTSSKDGKKSIVEEYEKALDLLSSEYKRLREEKLKKINGYRDAKDYHKGYEDNKRDAINEKSKAISNKKKMQVSKEYKQYLQDIQSLKKEIDLAIEEDDDEKIAIKRQELRELKRRNPTLQFDAEIKKADGIITEMEYKISEAKKYLEKLDEAKDMQLNQIESDRDSALSGLVKQNFWQKLVGSIFSKFGRAKNSAGEQIKGLIAKIKEEGKKISEKYAEQQEKNAQVKAEKAQEKAQAKAARDEEKRKQKEDFIKDIERRIADTERQLEAARAQRTQNNGKDMTPVFEGNGNVVPKDNIVPFERD